MSTKANVIIKDEYNKLYFYRHSDGYPGGTMPSLKKFLSWVKESKIRKNVEQSAGWLIIIGHTEYEIEDEPSKQNWKVGAFEPSTGIQGDIGFLYVVDLVKEKIEVYDNDFELHDK